MSEIYGSADYGVDNYGVDAGGLPPEPPIGITVYNFMNARKEGSGDSPRAAALLPLVPFYITESSFPASKWVAIQALLLLHWMQLEETAGGSENVGGQVGAVKSESEGQLSRSYGNAGDAINYGLNFLNMTMWGNELRTILRGNTFSFGIANGGVQIGTNMWF